MQSKWRSARGDYVQELQRKEQGGGFKEIEADEHVMRKQFVESHVAWQGWLRSKVRGQKRSFVLEKWPFERSFCKRKNTGFACPPPLSCAEWKSYCGLGFRARLNDERLVRELRSLVILVLPLDPSYFYRVALTQWCKPQTLNQRIEEPETTL